MKNNSLFKAIAAAAMLVSCSQQEPVPTADLQDGNEEEQAMAWSRTRSVDEAAEIALKAIGMLPQSDSRAGGRTFSKEAVKIARSESTSKSSQSAFDVDIHYVTITK